MKRYNMKRHKLKCKPDVAANLFQVILLQFGSDLRTLLQGRFVRSVYAPLDACLESGGDVIDCSVRS